MAGPLESSSGWVEAGAKVLGMVAPFVTFLFGRATRAQVNDKQLADTVIALKELQTTVSTHDKTLEKHNTVLESLKEDIDTLVFDGKENAAATNRMLGRLDRGKLT